MSKKLTFVIAAILLVVLAGCGGPSKKPTLGPVLLSESFNEPGAWETFRGSTTDLQVVDGVYRIVTGADGYIWGLNEQVHSNVVIEVEANQLSAHENNAYGLMCRADTSNNGDGYYFLVSGDGYYTIAKGSGPDVLPLVEWTKSDTVNEGRAKNTLRAVCVDDYLALYVNGKFVAETTDAEFSSGFAGLTATAFEEGDADISFDNLTIWEATIGN